MEDYLTGPIRPFPAMCLSSFDRNPPSKWYVSVKLRLIYPQLLACPIALTALSVRPAVLAITVKLERAAGLWCRPYQPIGARATGMRCRS